MTDAIKPKFSSLDMIAGALIAVILLGPLTAGMLAAQHASNETKGQKPSTSRSSARATSVIAGSWASLPSNATKPRK